MKMLKRCRMCFLLPVALVLMPGAAQAYVRVRISVKFIADTGGNLPGTGNINT